MVAGEREVLALLLKTTADALGQVLVGSAEGQAFTALAALSATRSLSRTVDDVLEALVRQARSEGATWQQVGNALGTTRQNAYQRFGHAEPEAERTEAMPTADAANDALEVFDAYARNDFERVARDFDGTMRERLTGELLSASWRQVTEAFGDYVSMGGPVERVIGQHAVIDIPLTFTRGEVKGRVAYDAERSVAGLFLLDPAVA